MTHINYLVFFGMWLTVLALSAKNARIESEIVGWQTLQTAATHVIVSPCLLDVRCTPLCCIYLAAMSHHIPNKQPATIQASVPQIHDIAIRVRSFSGVPSTLCQMSDALTSLPKKLVLLMDRNPRPIRKVRVDEPTHG